MRKLKWLIRDSLFGLGYFTGIGELYRALLGRRQGVVSFHNVLPSGVIGDGYVYGVDLSIEVFERQIDYLARRWRILPAEQIADREARGYFLTFDDGMLNAHDVVMPVLARHNLKAMFAVAPALVEGDIPHIWRDHIYLILRNATGKSLVLPFDGYNSPVDIGPENINPLGGRIRQWVVEEQVADVYGLVREICERNGIAYERLDYQPQRFHPVTWEMIKEMRANGHVIASHMWSHRIPTLLTKEQQEQELRKSKAVLEDRLDQGIDHLVYPYGGPAEVDADCMKLARECGYRTGFMNVPYVTEGPSGMNVPRFGLPATAYRPHLHAVLSGLKHALRR